MASLTRVRSLELAVHAHATEDLRKVEEALLKFLPEDVRNKVRIERVTLEGHHGNPIVRMNLVLEGEDAERAVKHIASMMDDTDKLLLNTSFEARYDEKSGKLFLRFSKQEAYLGRLRLMDGDDVVRVVVGFRGSPNTEKAKRFARELGLVP
ncbi:RNA-binding domain-containing protein [Pyrolobus fumarii]|uniref:RNA-binding domain-containing protein n=1 Tax=Pyrolobus fumarii TaxID=54252 RepID=UPI00064FF376|nr:RNA-binding domain-containing protein [Pyrolobus fumarii]